MIYPIFPNRVSQKMSQVTLGVPQRRPARGVLPSATVQFQGKTPPDSWLKKLSLQLLLLGSVMTTGGLGRQAVYERADADIVQICRQPVKTASSQCWVHLKDGDLLLNYTVSWEPTNRLPDPDSENWMLDEMLGGTCPMDVIRLLTQERPAMVAKVNEYYEVQESHFPMVNTMNLLFSGLTLQQVREKPDALIQALKGDRWTASFATKMRQSGVMLKGLTIHSIKMGKSLREPLTVELAVPLQEADVAPWDPTIDGC